MIGKIYDKMVECLESDLYLYNHLTYDKINFQVYLLYMIVFLVSDAVSLGTYIGKK